MKIRLKRSEFLNELAPMQGIVERRTTIPVLSHLLLKSDADRLELAATDLDVSLTSWCHAGSRGRGSHRRPGAQVPRDHPRGGR